MKITEETKLKDLIPNGFELDLNSDCEITVNNGIVIPVKKKKTEKVLIFEKYDSLSLIRKVQELVLDGFILHKIEHGGDNILPDETYATFKKVD